MGAGAPFGPASLIKMTIPVSSRAPTVGATFLPPLVFHETRLIRSPKMMEQREVPLPSFVPVELRQIGREIEINPTRTPGEVIENPPPLGPGPERRPHIPMPPLHPPPGPEIPVWPPGPRPPQPPPEPRPPLHPPPGPEIPVWPPQQPPDLVPPPSGPPEINPPVGSPPVVLAFTFN